MKTEMIQLANMTLFIHDDEEIILLADDGLRLKITDGDPNDLSWTIRPIEDPNYG